MSFTPVMTTGDRAKVMDVVRTHVRNCKLCTSFRRRRAVENTAIHEAEVKAVIVLVTKAHVKSCYTCKTRGEAAIKDHQKAIVEMFKFNGTLL